MQTEGTRLAIDPRLHEVISRLIDDLRPERIFLFGSRARPGEARPDSDYDLMVVVSKSELPRYQRAQEAYRLLFGVGIPLDIVVLTRQEFEQDLEAAASLPATVLREGRLLYAA